MNNNIVFDNENNDSNDDLLKNNTPNTIDYNTLYNTSIQNNAINNANNITNSENSVVNNQNDNPNFINNQNNPSNVINNLNNVEQVQTVNNPEISENKKKKGIDSLLFVFLIFIFIMGIIIFLFPLLSNYLFG